MLSSVMSGTFRAGVEPFATMTHKLVEIDLQLAFYHDDFEKLLSTICRCKNLNTLKLQCDRRASVLSQTISFPSGLKSLQLKEIMLSEPLNFEAMPDLWQLGLWLCDGGFFFAANFSTKFASSQRGPFGM
jgi:hypothetical protein